MATLQRMYGSSASRLAEVIAGFEDEEEEDFEEDFEEDYEDYEGFDNEEEDDHKHHNREHDHEDNHDHHAHKGKNVGGFSGKVLEVWGKRLKMTPTVNRTPKDSGFECPICLCDDALMTVRIPDCGHVYCEGCLRLHCEGQLQDRSLLRQNLLVVRRIQRPRGTDLEEVCVDIELDLVEYGIRCPDPSCQFVMRGQDLQECWPDMYVSNQFQHLAALDRRDATPGTCYCPRCGELAMPVYRRPMSSTGRRARKRNARVTRHVQGREIVDESPYRCSSSQCLIQFCGICYRNLHPGKSCKDANRVYKRSDPVSKLQQKSMPLKLRQLLVDPHFLEQAFSIWVSQAATESRLKMCPKCSEPIEKNLGCDHMYCTKCQHHFSWMAAPHLPPHRQTAWYPGFAVMHRLLSRALEKK